MLPEETLQDALDAIRVAVALGMPVPAPVGTHVFNAKMNVYEAARRRFSLGLYSTEEAALTAVRNWVVDEWGSLPTTPDPFGDSPLADDGAPDFSHRSDKEILDMYFDDEQIDTYEIEQENVLSPPFPRGF